MMKRFPHGVVGLVSLSLLAIFSSATGCSADADVATTTDPVSAALAQITNPPPLALHLLPICRLVDTRFPENTAPHFFPPGSGQGLPKLSGGTFTPAPTTPPDPAKEGTPTRDFAVATRCNVPANAKGIYAHIVSANSEATGFLVIAPATCGNPPNSVCPNPKADGIDAVPHSPTFKASLNYTAGQVVAEGAVLELGEAGIRVFSSQNTDFIMDVQGYFEEVPQPAIRVTPAAFCEAYTGAGPVPAGACQNFSPIGGNPNPNAACLGVAAGCDDTWKTKPENIWYAYDDTLFCGPAQLSYTNGEPNGPPLGTGAFQVEFGGKRRCSGTAASCTTTADCTSGPTPPGGTCTRYPGVCVGGTVDTGRGCTTAADCTGGGTCPTHSGDPGFSGTDDIGGGAAIGTDAQKGLKISSITGLRYSTRSDSADSNAPYLYINVDDAAPGCADNGVSGPCKNNTLYYYPANNAPLAPSPLANVWQTWDAGGGVWNLAYDYGAVVYRNDFTKCPASGPCNQPSSATGTGTWGPLPSGSGSVTWTRPLIPVSSRATSRRTGAVSPGQALSPGSSTRTVTAPASMSSSTSA